MRVVRIQICSLSTQTSWWGVDRLLEWGRVMDRVGCGEDMAVERPALVLVCVFRLLAVDGLYEAA